MATPALVQHIASPNTGSGPGGTTTFTAQFINPSLSGNYLQLVIFLNSGVTVSAVTDDQSQTWTASRSFTTGSNANGYIFTRLNTAAGVLKVTITVSTASTVFISYTLSEWNNVTAVNTTIVHEDTVGTTSWTAGSFTPTSGDLVYSAHQSTSLPLNSATLFTAMASPAFSLESADLADGLASQSVIAGAGAINPAMTAVSSTALSLAIALTSGAQGSAFPAGIYVKRLQGSAFQSPGTTPKYQFPCDGNLVLMSGSGGQDVVNSLTGLTYTQHANSPLANGVGGKIYHWHADNITPARTLNGVITWSASPGGANVWFMDVMGAAVAPLDNVTSATGTQGSPGNLTVFTLTPTAAAGLLLAYVDHNSGSETGATGTGVNFLLPYMGQDGGAGTNWTLDSGFSLKYTSSATAFTYTRSATAAGAWEALGMAYRAPAGASDTLFAQSIF